VLSQNCERRLLASSCLSVRTSIRKNNWAPTGWIFIILDIWGYFKHVEQVQYSLKSNNNSGCFMWRPIHIFFIYRSILLQWKMFKKKLYRKSKQTFYTQWMFFETPAVYRITWKNIVEAGRPQITIWRMGIEWWIPKAANRHSKYVILVIIAFHCKNGCTNATQRYVIRTLSVFFFFVYYEWFPANLI